MWRTQFQLFFFHFEKNTFWSYRLLFEVVFHDMFTFISIKGHLTCIVCIVSKVDDGEYPNSQHYGYDYYFIHVGKVYWDMISICGAIMEGYHSPSSVNGSYGTARLRTFFALTARWVIIGKFSECSAIMVASIMITFSLLIHF